MTRLALYLALRTWGRGANAALHPGPVLMACEVVYFAIVAVLLTYGFHKYFIVFEYFRTRKKAAAEPAARIPEELLPYVTVQLPVFNEQYVIDRLVEAVCKLDYPRSRLEIQVLDDSTDESAELARKTVETYHALGHNIRFLHRSSREGFKAGALAAGLAQARGKFIAIFDADFVPAPDWLRIVIHFFTDPAVGMVQTRWAHFNRRYSLLTHAQAIRLDGHFVLEQGARSCGGMFFNFNGTGGIWRRSAIEDAGGWEFDTLTEDSDISYRALLKGWRFIYLKHSLCPGELPVEMTAFKTQQARWAKGLIQVAIKIIPRVFRADLPWKVKMEAWYHLTGDISYPLALLLTVLLFPVIMSPTYYGNVRSFLLIGLPIFMVSMFPVTAFHLFAQRELFPRKWYSTLVFLPVVMLLDLGLTISNSRAVLEAVTGKRMVFERTPKYRVTSRSDKPMGTLKYRKRLGLLPWIELAFGACLLGVVFYAWRVGNWIAAIFLALFVSGYCYSGLMSLLQGRSDFQVQPGDGNADRSRHASAP